MDNRGITQSRLAQLIRSAFDSSGDSQKTVGAFGGLDRFNKTIKAVEKIEKTNGPMILDDIIIKDELFKLGPWHSPEQTAAEFCRLMDKWDNRTRPSLPAITYAWFDHLNLKNQSMIDAALLLSTRAEMVKGVAPEDAGVMESEPHYHSRIHFLHVIQATGHLLEKNNLGVLANDNTIIKLSNHDKGLIMLAAIAHDLDHPGHGNRTCIRQGKPILYENEQASFAIADKILQGCNIAQKDRDIILMMLRTTDPNGPHKFMKDVMKAHEKGRMPLHMSDIVPGEEERFAALEPLLTDRKLCYMCAILSDADLFVSAGAGPQANRVNSEKFTREERAMGVDCDFTTASARDGFFQHVVGETGFASAIGRKAFNKVYLSMVSDTQKELAAQKPAP